jgi:hypothetical protein
MIQELTIEFELLLIKRLAPHILLDILPQKFERIFAINIGSRLLPGSNFILTAQLAE